MGIVLIILNWAYLLVNLCYLDQFILENSKVIIIIIYMLTFTMLTGFVIITTYVMRQYK